MPTAIKGRLERIGSLIDILRSIDDYVVISAVPALIASIKKAKEVCSKADVSDPDQLREAVDSVLMVLQAGALCTVTDKDDDTVEMIRKLRSSIDFLIPIVSSWLAGNRTFGATDEDAAAAGIDPATILLIIELVATLINWWRKR